MITFHNERLAPPELCTLLYQTVPEEFHVPVVFANRSDNGRRRILGTCFGTHIVIYLHQIYWSALFETAGSLASNLWRQLLDTCYHEFGHIATWQQYSSLPTGAYVESFRSYQYVERLAIEWSEQKMLELRDRDTRLAQPTLLRGYMGARLVELDGRRRQFDWDMEYVGSALAAHVKERRCLKTGGQLSSGDVLRLLRMKSRRYPSACAVLREVSDGIGVEHIDGAGRRHKLYTWGDLPVLGTRLAQHPYFVSRASESQPRPVPSGWSGVIDFDDEIFDDWFDDDFWELDEEAA